MPTKRIDELPPAAAQSGHELPAMIGGVTSKITVASIVASGAAGNYLPLSGGVLTGDLTIGKPNPALILNKSASGQNSSVAGKLNDANRWTIDLGNTTAETGSNAGSDFAIYRYSDSGAYLGSPLVISRASGTLSTGPLSANGNIYSNGVITAQTTLTSSGNATVGTSLSVGTTISANGAISTTGSGSFATGCFVQDGSFTGSKTNSYAAGFSRNGSTGGVVSLQYNETQVGSISVTGSSTSYNTSSDGRLKTNVVPMEDVGPILDALQVVTFDWIRTGDPGYGLIAQDAIEVFAPPVFPGTDIARSDIPEDDPEFEAAAIDYSKYVPLLLKEIQSLRARVAALEGA